MLPVLVVIVVIVVTANHLRVLGLFLLGIDLQVQV